MGEPASRSRAVGQPIRPRLLPLSPNDLEGFLMLLNEFIASYASYESAERNFTREKNYEHNEGGLRPCDGRGALLKGQRGSGCGCEAKLAE